MGSPAFLFLMFFFLLKMMCSLTYTVNIHFFSYQTRPPGCLQRYLLLGFLHLWSQTLTWFHFLSFSFFALFLPHSWHMEVSRLGVKLELQLPAYTTATATQDPRCICNLHHSSGQLQILNPLSKARA